MSIRRKLLVAIPLALLLVVAGCKVNSINYFPPHPANVRVINLVPDIPSVDVQIAGNPAFTGVLFEKLTSYQSYENTATNFSVNVTGNPTTILNFTYNLAGEQPYTLVIYGSSTSPSATLLSEVPSPPTNGNIQLSVFNAAINQVAIDIYVNVPGTDITTVNPNYGGVVYNGTSLNLAFPPGTYQIQVTISGSKTVIYDSGGTALTPNIALTLIAYSKGSGFLVNASVVQSGGGGTLLDSIFAQTKVMNGASAIGPVNQLLDTTYFALNVGYASATSYTQTPRGGTFINIEASSTPGATIASTPARLGTARDHSIFVTGLPGSQQVFVLADMNLPPISGSVRVRFVNTSWNSNPVNVSVNGVLQATALAFPTASAYAQIAAGTYPITFTDATTGALVLTLDSVVLTAGQTNTVYVIGPAGALGGVVAQDN